MPLTRVNITSKKFLRNLAAVFSAGASLAFKNAMQSVQSSYKVNVKCSGEGLKEEPLPSDIEGMVIHIIPQEFK